MRARDVQPEARSSGYVGTRRYTFENERLHQTAELVAAVHCDPDGTKHLDAVSEAGWGSANKHVLHKMLESESETSSPANRAKSRLTTDNYYFTMVGTEGIEGRLTYVMDVTPKRREKYLMEGRIWVDGTDYALVRAEGKPAHSPSFWTHIVHFVHQYQEKGDFWFYATELLETDWSKIEEKIQAAENGIKVRLHEFSMNHGGTLEENRAIEDALHGLNTLRKEVAARQGSKQAG